MRRFYFVSNLCHAERTCQRHQPVSADHANDLVEWQEWGEAALEVARSANSHFVNYWLSDAEVAKDGAGVVLQSQRRRRHE